MNASTATDQNLLREIVRGKRPLRHLQILGMRLELQGNHCRVANPRHISTSVDVHDLAMGLVTYLSDPEALREWALFIQAGDVDLDVEDHPAGEAVLKALWDAAFMNPINPLAVDTLKQLEKV